MADTLAIIGATGKLGSATLAAILENKLWPAENIVCTTSSDKGAEKLRSAYGDTIQIRRADWDNRESWREALQNCTKVLLISSARVEKDFNEAPHGQGREEDHFRVLAAAREVGVKHIYYTSLAFANPSHSRVMKAHERTEAALKDSDFSWTLIREGLYSESWPLYLGHYDVPSDDRSDIYVAGDGKINWTAIPDLGLATALVITARSETWAGKTFYLAQQKSFTLAEVAQILSQIRGKAIKREIISASEHEKHYIDSRGVDPGFVKWWSPTYEALLQGECSVNDSTLETLLASVDRVPIQLEETMRKMFEEAVGFTGR